MSLFRTLRIAVAPGLFVSGLALAAGCVGDDDPVVPGPKYPSEASFCQALAEAVCSAKVVEGCYGANNTANTTSCRDAFRGEGCNPNHYGYHHEGAEACIEKMKAIYADGALTKAELEGADAVCVKALSNTLGPNGPCEVDAQCDAADGLSCVIKPGQHGTCQVAEEVEGGFPCAAPNQVCVEGFFCIDGNCLAGRQLNQVCSDVQPCAVELLCSIPPTMMEGMCIAKKADGQQCVSDDECVSGFCVTTCRSNLPLIDPEACASFLPG